MGVLVLELSCGFRVWGLVFRVWDLGFRLRGLGFRVLNPTNLSGSLPDTALTLNPTPLNPKHSRQQT